MRLLKVKDIYLPDCYPSEAKGDTVDYFIYGQGWKKKKKFKVVEGVDLPERHEILSWFDIAILYDKYGIEVANQYAERKTAGIVSRQMARSYGYIYGAIKDILPDNFDKRFFDCLCCMWEAACFGLFIFDISATDDKLGDIDKKYKPLTCTYTTMKGEDMKEVSMKKYVDLKYGQDYSAIIDRLCDIVDLSQPLIKTTQP